jgi:hypothetical protein
MELRRVASEASLRVRVATLGGREEEPDIGDADTEFSMSSSASPSNSDESSHQLTDSSHSMSDSAPPRVSMSTVAGFSQCHVLYPAISLSLYLFVLFLSLPFSVSLSVLSFARALCPISVAAANVPHCL